MTSHPGARQLWTVRDAFAADADRTLAAVRVITPSDTATDGEQKSIVFGSAW